MNKKIKKIITGVVLLSALCVPSIASAAANRLTGGTVAIGTKHYEYADYSYHQVCAYLTTYSTRVNYDKVYGWQSCHTKSLPGTVCRGTGQTGFSHS